ncbi:MAG TPA: phosphate ABC transporter ATP-binding protein PstB [Clostridia bacterium]
MLAEEYRSCQNKINVKRLNTYFNEFHALKDVNIEIPANAITVLIGPSGCGKSTFLKTLNRMNELESGCKTTGTVTLDGIDIFHRIDAVELRRKVGMVFQKPNPFPMSIYDNVAYGPRIHGIKKKAVLERIVEESLRRAALWNEVKDRLKKSAESLSGGQQQRLCIARALAVEPEVLLMDEPTSSLDPVSTEKIELLCKSLKNEYTIIITTHNIRQAIRISDKAAFFLNGTIIGSGPPEKILINPKDKRIRSFISVI